MAKPIVEPRGYKGWFGTSWYPATLPETEEAAMQYFTSKLASATHYAGQLERAPETGKLHFQWAARWHSQKRLSTLRELLGEGHYDRLGAEVDALKYVTKNETRVFGPWVKGWCVPEKVTCMVCDMGPLPWQAALETELLAPPDDRKVIWIYDKDGHQGKSKFVKHMALKYPSWVMVGGKSEDCFFAIKNHLEPEEGTGKPLRGVMLDYCRPDADAHLFNYTVMEKCKDGMLFNAKYKAGQLIFNCVHVVIMANVPPVKTKLSADRWDVRELKDGVLAPYVELAPIFF